MGCKPISRRVRRVAPTVRPDRDGSRRGCAPAAAGRSDPLGCRSLGAIFPIIENCFVLVKLDPDSLLQKLSAAQKCNRIVGFARPSNGAERAQHDCRRSQEVAVGGSTHDAVHAVVNRSELDLYENSPIAYGRRARQQQRAVGIAKGPSATT